jgi:hypothetical protein
METLRWMTNETLVTALDGGRTIRTLSDHPGYDRCLAHVRPARHLFPPMALHRRYATFHLLDPTLRQAGSLARHLPACLVARRHPQISADGAISPLSRPR